MSLLFIAFEHAIWYVCAMTDIYDNRRVNLGIIFQKFQNFFLIPFRFMNLWKLKVFQIRKFQFFSLIKTY